MHAEDDFKMFEKNKKRRKKQYNIYWEDLAGDIYNPWR